MQGWKPLQGMELQEKEAQKNWSIQEICIQRIYWKPLQGMELQEKEAQKNWSIQEICIQRIYH